MTQRSSPPSTVLELFDRASDKVTLSWAAEDLSPAPAWDAPAADSSGWCVLDGEAVGRYVWSLAAGLVSLGVRPGDRVALMMTNRPEHWLTDQAVLQAGAIPCTFYPTLSAEQIRSQAEHAQISTVVLEGATQLEQWSLAILSPQLRRVIVLDPQALPAALAAVGHTYAETLDRGADQLARDVDTLTEAGGGVRVDDPATIIFTSGTTAAPKAVVITHRNVLAVLSGIDVAGTMPDLYRTVSYLPTAHIVDRMGSIYLALASGGEIAFSPTPQAFVRIVSRYHPTSLIGVPRIWERLLAGLDSMVDTENGKDRLQTTGLDRLEFATTAGAPMPPETSSKLRDHGLPLVDMWGLTESTGTITISSAEEFRERTVGRPLPGVELRACSDGELWVRGPQIAEGYLGPDGSVSVLTDSDGWLATGDLGRVAGTGRPCLVALLTLDAAQARAWLGTQHGIDATRSGGDELIVFPEISAEVARAVHQANSRLARAEQLKQWQLLARSWSPEDGALTPIQKLRRRVLLKRHRDLVEVLYQQPGSPR